MDFEFSEAQRDLAAMVRDRPQWTDMAASGVLAAALPESAGGNGFGLLEQCSVLVELGRAMSSAPYLPSIVQAASTVARFGTAEAVDRWVRPALTGSTVLSVALSEENNDDPLAPVTRASQVDGGWRLTGTKSLVPPGEVFLVPASTSDGLRLFLVRADEASVLPQEVVDGDDSCLLDLADVHLDDDRVLPGEAVSFALHRGVVGHCALQLGVVERALEMTTEYARTRQQFDRPIGSFQAVTQRLADAYIQVEAIRLTLWQAAWRLSEGLPCDTELATAKFWAAEGGHYVAHTAVHVHGGMGIDLSHPLHRYFTAAKRHEFALGGATTQLRHIGSALAATPV
ncbi:acyl-CoA dehydrogenase family protein [Kutzneria sp. 744]|uniref:acyl-CoA dehydrogenase family protein n=1 Tax=Kutzneria sp. (strain 744) TaxID=345341 RepID=UPI0003EEC128|nr:acyl-CoA dehydrogenase family protein [Kutzneria sp. 744]EWM11154.1 acyl-CoA dehydrogenase [Kutzneria sp. 744]